MSKVNWLRKVTSRKFWLSLASFISMMIVAKGGTENEAAQIVSLIMAGASIIGYVIGEGLTDNANVSADPDQLANIDWLRKLTSRKLWLSVASFVSMMVVATGGTESHGAQIAALIMAGATVVAYALGEGFTDAADGSGDDLTVDTEIEFEDADDEG